MNRAGSSWRAMLLVGFLDRRRERLAPGVSGEERRDRIGHQATSVRRPWRFNAADFRRPCKRQAHRQYARPSPRHGQAWAHGAQQSGAAPKVEANAARLGLRMTATTGRGRCGTMLAKRCDWGRRGFPRHSQGQEVVNDVSNGNFSPHAPEDDRLRRRGGNPQSRRGRPRIRRQGSHGRHRLCRRARRLRLEPGACGRHQGAEGGAGRQGRRGRERAGDRRGLEVDGVDDQSRRRGPHPGDLVRLLQALRRRPRQEIPGRRVPPRGAVVEQGQGSEERRLLFRLSQSGALRRTASPPASRPRRTRSASSPPSRSPACSATSIRSCSARDRSIRRRPCR